MTTGEDWYLSRLDEMLKTAKLEEQGRAVSIIESAIDYYLNVEKVNQIPLGVLSDILDCLVYTKLDSLTLGEPK